jgi:hypothetical protein
MREMMMKMMVEMMWEMMLETMLVGILQAWILVLVEIPQLGLELIELGERGKLHLVGPPPELPPKSWVLIKPSGK